MWSNLCWYYCLTTIASYLDYALLESHYSIIERKLEKRPDEEKGKETRQSMKWLSITRVYITCKSICVSLRLHARNVWTYASSNRRLATRFAWRSHRWLLILLTLVCVRTTIVRGSTSSLLSLSLRRSRILASARTSLASVCSVMISDSFIFEASPLGIILWVAVVVFCFLQSGFNLLRSKNVERRSQLVILCHTRLASCAYIQALEPHG